MVPSVAVPRRNAVPPREGPFRTDSERLARADIDGDSITIRDVRDSTFPAPNEFVVQWSDETFDLREITNVWIYVGYFGPSRGVAHTEIGFEFADFRCVTVSFEIRPLKGQRYTIRGGMGRNFEMCLRWVTERDALLRRFYRDEERIDTELHMFEAAITHSKSMDLFRSAALRTNELYENPEWYHSIGNTCATSLVKMANDALAKDMRSTPRLMLPGYLPKFWAKHGVLKLNGNSFDQALKTSMINDRVREIGYVPDFSARLHNRV